MNEVLLAVDAIVIGILGLAVLIVLTAALAVWTAICIPAEYFFAMGKLIDSELTGSAKAEESHIGRLVRVGGHTDQARTFPQYFFGQVQVDAEKVFYDFKDRVRALLAGRWASAAELLESSNSHLESLIGFSVRASVVLGAVCGLLLSAVIAIVHLIVIIVCVIAAALASIILRAVDAITRIVTGVRMVCPVCVQVVRPYAIYKCASCGEMHRDVRSGRRGILARVCSCGQRLPTLLLTGAGRLAATCPRCLSPLPPRFGKTSEILIAFIGSVGAGKTQLIHTLVESLTLLASNNGGSSELLGKSQDEFDRIERRLSLTGSPGPTIPESPEALVLHLALGSRRRRRFFYLFDPAGELHYRDHGLDELPYLGKARTLVYVADPLAAPGVWDRLDGERKQELAAMRSDWGEAVLAYEMSSESIKRMADKKNRMRLAFVLTKSDTLSDLPTLADEVSVRKFVEDPGWMDMRNVVRAAMQSFDTVKFFAASATRDESGVPDASIEELAEWLTGVEGAGTRRR
jgi:Double-GTPase 2